jgi:hypothetical protein
VIARRSFHVVASASCSYASTNPTIPTTSTPFAVLRQNGEQIGYLEREFAGQVVSRLATSVGIEQ